MVPYFGGMRSSALVNVKKRELMFFPPLFHEVQSRDGWG